MRDKWRLLKPTTNERAQRLWAGTEAGAMGYGGVAAVARATGLAISTVRKSRDEVRAGAKASDVVNVRRSAGKRPFETAHPNAWPALEKLVDPVTRGNPESPLRWTCKSTHVLAAELFTQPGTSKWNKIEHRLFSFISINWRGRPLRAYETVVNLIANTTNRGGLVIRARLDRRSYPIGQTVSAQELRELNIERDVFHGDGTTCSGRGSMLDRLSHAFAGLNVSVSC